MKTTKFFVFLYIVVILAIFEGCKKNGTSTITPKTKTEMLTNNAWQMQKIRFTELNSPQLYERGGSANTKNYDIESIKFTTPNTGSTTTSLGTFPITWSFQNPDQTKLTFTIAYSPSNNVVVNWEDIIYNDTISIRYTEYFTNLGTNFVTTATRTHKP